MPTIECPNCGHKMVFANPTCPSCGYPLTASTGGTSPVKTSSPLPPMSSPLSSVPPFGSGTSLPVPFGTPTPPIVSHGTSTPVSAGASATSPISASAASMPLTIPIGTSSIGADLEGTIIYPPTPSEIVASPEWSHMVLGCLFFPLLLIFRPMMVILGLIGLQGRQERKIPVTTITIQQSSGSMHSARIEGDLMGVGLNQGDYVSLWGRDRSGTLIVKRGYNHTMHGDIQVRSRHSHLISRTVAIALLVFIAYVLLMISLSSVR